MPRFKSVLKSCVVETAKGKRSCRHNKSHSILKGQKCLVIREGSYRRYVYCVVCAEKMLRADEDKIEGISAQLSDGLEVASH